MYLARAIPLVAVRKFSTPTRPHFNIPWQSVDESTQKASQNIYDMVAQTQPKPTTNEDLWMRISQEAKEELKRAPPHDPYFGRSVNVVDGRIQEALKRLNNTLSRNKVAKQLRMTERHEKKGVKRRRLESERWRRLFAHEVRKNVQLVTKIRDRGA